MDESNANVYGLIDALVLGPQKIVENHDICTCEPMCTCLPGPVVLPDLEVYNRINFLEMQIQRLFYLETQRRSRAII